MARDIDLTPYSVWQDDSTGRLCVVITTTVPPSGDGPGEVVFRYAGGRDNPTYLPISSFLAGFSLYRGDHVHA